MILNIRLNNSNKGTTHLNGEYSAIPALPSPKPFVQAGLQGRVKGYNIITIPCRKAPPLSARSHHLINGEPALQGGELYIYPLR
jgi:hypothetical protein